eukprot:1171999-Pyramimonas_sp.AAC.1
MRWRGRLRSPNSSSISGMLATKPAVVFKIPPRQPRSPSTHWSRKTLPTPSATSTSGHGRSRRRRDGS